jgi:energy-converting hydrogenase Eha subunit F
LRKKQSETNQYHNKGFTAISSTGGIMDEVLWYYQFDFENVKVGS